MRPRIILDTNNLIKLLFKTIKLHHITFDDDDDDDDQPHCKFTTKNYSIIILFLYKM